MRSLPERTSSGENQREERGARVEEPTEEKEKERELQRERTAGVAEEEEEKTKALIEARENRQREGETETEENGEVPGAARMQFKTHTGDRISKHAHTCVNQSNHLITNNLLVLLFSSRSIGLLVCHTPRGRSLFVQRQSAGPDNGPTLS